MSDGYIKLWRKSEGSRAFLNEGLWKVWTWCLMKASYSERWVSMKSGKSFIEIKLMPGQFVFGRLSASKSLKMKPSTVRNRIYKLQTMRNLDIKEDTQYSIVTILNWSEYQSDENQEGQQRGQPEDKQRTAGGHPEDTNKKVKKVKEGNKNKTIFPEKFLLDDSMIKYCMEKSITKKPDSMFEDFKNNHTSKGNKFVDWKSAWQTWCRNDAKYNKPKKGAMKKNGFTKEYYQRAKKTEPRKSYSELLKTR